MSKASKITLIIVASVLLVLLITALILFLVLREPYLEELNYDTVDGAIYNGQMIASKDGLWYLVTDGVPSEKGYSYLKSVNDFYTGSSADQLATRRLFDLYLAKDAEDGKYLLIDKEGTEYRIEGDNFSLSEVALPYLIFTNNTNGRKGAISLLALSSELSAHADGNLSMTKTFLSLSPQKYDDEAELYDLLLAESEDELQKDQIYNASGKKLLSGGDLTTRQFENEAGKYVFYFVDETTYAVYSSDGVQLSDGKAAPILSADSSWAYQISAPLSETASSDDLLLLVFSAQKTLTLDNTDYDFSSIRVAYNSLLIDKIHTDETVVISPQNGTLATYDSVTVGFGALIAEIDGVDRYIYLSGDGRELLRSTYGDLVASALSTDSCTVLTSALYDATLSGSHAYFFTSPTQQATILELPLSDQVISPSVPCLDECDTPIYLISESQTDGTALSRIYTPFALNAKGNAYHAIDFYCHGGIVWALGTSYSAEVYDLLDPVNNRVVQSITAEDDNLARLSFTYRNTSALLADSSDPDSAVPVVMLQLTRYEDRQSSVTSGRYFALYRTAYRDTKGFQNASLQVKEIGQNLLKATPYEFFSADNCLIAHHVSGSRIYRLDQDLKLIEHLSLTYHVTDLLSDLSDPSKLYWLVSPLTDGSASPLSIRYYGLADSEGNMILQPCYESIVSADGDRFVVTLRNATGVVERKKEKIKTLIDFKYTSITPLSDGGYLAERPDDTYALYDGDTVIEDERIASVAFVSVVQTDDDGFLSYGKAPLLNIDGELQIHYPKTFTAPVCSYVSTPGSHSGSLTDRRAKLIYYHDATTGEAVSHELLIPTVTAATEFAEQFASDEWYVSKLPDEQNNPITAEEILLSSDRFFHLYPSAKTEE